MIMAQHQVTSQAKGNDPLPIERVDMKDEYRPALVQSQSDPSPTKRQDHRCDSSAEEVSSGESRDTIRESTFPKFSQTSHLQVQTPRQSSSTYRESPPSSRPQSPINSSRPSLPSSITSTSVTVDVPAESKNDHVRRPSILTRLKSSINPLNASSHDVTPKLSAQPSDFQRQPEQPEKHFIDSIGMVIPGVCNRSQCAHPLAHFVTNWRLCEPIEYTTAMAEHGITYSDHCRLTAAISSFVDEITHEQRRRAKSRAPRWHLRRRRSANNRNFKGREDVVSAGSASSNITTTESGHQFKEVENQAAALDKLLHEISWNWQKRGIPVMVCISSFSLFSPNRILEAHVQILHVPLQSPAPRLEAMTRSRPHESLSFIDPFAISKVAGRSVAVPHHQLGRRSISTSSVPGGGFQYHHQQLQLRDRTRPWPLWPNAIPSRKRELMHDHADRYGVDPYFRAWMRANINSRTRSTSYAKYMIEQEDNPFINKRLDYVTPPSKRALMWGLLTIRPKRWKEQYASVVNRGNYEHNRKLECRKTVEHGSRLRIVRFGFRHPIYPPHTPEMEELGLTMDGYQTIINNIETIRQHYKSRANECMPHFFASWNKLRRRSTKDALTKVSEYVRQINAVDRRIVWTIEKIPGVYDRGFGRDKKEWEISAWNGEDPLELLIQLEKWGIIEKRLNIDDDE